MLRNDSYVLLVVLKAMEKRRYEMLETDLQSYLVILDLKHCNDTYI